LRVDSLVNCHQTDTISGNETLHIEQISSHLPSGGTLLESLQWYRSSSHENTVMERGP